MSMLDWIKSYEERRHSSKGPREPNWALSAHWASTKYDFADPSVTSEYVPSQGCSVGDCINSMKKLWKKYRILGYNGEPRGDIAWKLRNLQRDLGLIERSEFPELEG